MLRQSTVRGSATKSQAPRRHSFAEALWDGWGRGPTAGESVVIATVTGRDVVSMGQERR